MASLKGFEPPTHGLEGRCSILLSYRLTERAKCGAHFVCMERVMGIGPTQSAWKADILPLNYTRVFRSARLDAHKMFGINSMLENLIIICRRCQEFLHNRTQIIKYFTCSCPYAPRGQLCIAMQTKNRGVERAIDRCVGRYMRLWRGIFVHKKIRRNAP